MQLPTSLGWRWIWSRSGRAEGGPALRWSKLPASCFKPTPSAWSEQTAKRQSRSKPHSGNLAKGKGLVTNAKKKIAELETQLQQLEGERNELLAYRQQAERE